MANDAPAGTISRAIALLRVLAEADGPISVSTAAERLDLPPSTTHRLLHLLASEDVVEHLPATRRYDVGVEYVRLAGLVTAKSDVVALALPVMRRVVEARNESCLLGLFRPNGHDMVFAAQVESTQALRFHIPLQEPMSALWGCSGRVILAYLDEEAVKQVVRGTATSPVTGAKPPSAAKLLRDVLPAIRERGWDFTEGEKIPDSVGLAAPVFAGQGRVIGSLSVSIPAARYDPGEREALADLVTGAASELSATLGAI